MPIKWIDFKGIKSSVDFNQVLADYGIELKSKGHQEQGFCPLPQHEGKGRSPSFSVNTQKRIFQCFGCGAKGNIIDFVAFMEGFNPEDKDDFRKAAMLLQERYRGAESANRKGEQMHEEEAVEDDHPRVVNTPLNFELKRLNPDHANLKKRGLSRETVDHFGLGYCKQGLMKGRIAIPLHDADANLVGYAGRLVNDEAIAEDNPKYRLTGTRERDGTLYEFSKSRFLFNGHRISGPVSDLILVEGFFGTFWLHQQGYPNVLALMGSTCSDKQVEIMVDLIKPSGRLWIMSDGDEAGVRCAHELLAKVAPRRSARWAKLEEDKQPEDHSAESLAAILWLHGKED